MYSFSHFANLKYRWEFFKGTPFQDDWYTLSKHVVYIGLLSGTALFIVDI